MRAFQQALSMPGMDVRASILDDLSGYYHLPSEECIERCRDWEQWSVREWQARERGSEEGLRDFYLSTQSWSFDLLWYAYMQAAGCAYPVSVAIARTLPPPKPGARHLDFGSGIGATAQLFTQLGYQSDLADVSVPLLEFAKYRIERRGSHAGFIDLNQASPPEGVYDVITAIDTLAHVPNVAETAGMLHRALKPGGYLFANFDVRPQSDENAWHLYTDDRPLRWAVHRAGFEQDRDLEGYSFRYRRVEPAGTSHAIRGVRDMMLLRSPLRAAYRSIKRMIRR
jgi:2-polyprenyl-3-methyl-5-hydroxy-6-metoxy-1,4-benzoquinol methylase